MYYNIVKCKIDVDFTTENLVRIHSRMPSGKNRIIPNRIVVYNNSFNIDR